MGTLSRCGLAACAVVGLAAGTAGAAIVYHDPPDVVLNWSLTPTGFDLNADNRTDLQLLAFPPSNNGRSIVYAPVGGAVRSDPSLGVNLLPYAAAMKPGVLINAGGPWEREAMLGYYPEFGPYTGNWLFGGPHMFALRFQSAEGEHFAWVRVSANSVRIVLHDYAYESDPGVPIAAGAVPGAGGLGAASAMAVWGTPKRRRRIRTLRP
ncbi:MAG: hypothetical protein H6809_01260 [Phycisphaeraceae bacterium]|nr:hypothetical protein [Phycisphaeraceae bacterium]